MSKQPKNAKFKVDNQALQNIEPSFDSHLDLFFDILTTPRNTRSQKECNDIICALKKTKFYKEYEKDLVAKPELLTILAQGMGCECFRSYSKIYDENQIAKKVFIVMEGEVVLMSNFINKISPKIYEQMEKAKAKQLLKEIQAAAALNNNDLKKRPKKPPAKTFDERYPIQERFASLHSLDMFGDTDLRYRGQYSMSAVTRKNTHLAIIPADIFQKHFIEKSKILEEVHSVAKCDLFKFLSHQYVELCMKFATEVQINIGSTIFKEGDVANDLYFIKEGEIEFSMNPTQKIEQERKKIREIKAKFGENPQSEDGFDEVKFEASTLFYKAMYEKGQSKKQSKQFWSLDEHSYKDMKIVKELKGELLAQKNKFQEKGLQIYEDDDQEQQFSNDATNIMFSSVQKKLKKEKIIKCESSKSLSVSGVIERHEGVIGYKLYTLSEGDYFGEENIFSNSNNSTDTLNKFSSTAIQILSLSGSEFVNEDFSQLKVVPGYRKMTATCKSSTCTLLKMSYKLFLNFVCLGHRELQMVSTLMSSQRHIWSQNKIQLHTEKMKDSQIKTSSKSNSDSNFFPMATLKINNQQLPLSQAKQSFSIDKLSQQESIFLTEKQNQQGSFTTMNSPERSISSLLREKRFPFNPNIFLSQSKELTNKSQVPSPSRNLQIKNSLLLENIFQTQISSPSPTPIIKIPKKNGFKVSLDETEENSIHSPKFSFTYQPRIAKASRFSEMLISEYHLKNKKQDFSHSYVPSPKNHGASKKGSFEIYKEGGLSIGEKQHPSSCLNSPMSSVWQKEAHAFNHFAPLELKSKYPKPLSINLLSEVDMEEEKEINQKESSQLNQDENQNIPSSMKFSVNLKSQSKQQFRNNLLNKQLSIYQKSESKTFITKNLTSQTQNDEDSVADHEGAKHSQKSIETNQGSLLLLGRKSSRIIQDKSNSKIATSTFAFQHLVNEIAQSDRNDSENSKNKTEKPKRVNLEIMHDFYNKKYRRAFNEAQSVGQITLKPQSFLVLSNTNGMINNSISEKEEKFLQLQKKHQIEKKFPKSMMASKINDYFNQKVESIKNEHKESIYKIKMASKDMNIKLFCEQLTREVIQQEQKQKQEYEEASTLFNFTQSGKKQEKC